ncbi:MAG: dTMP kinase [Candidatus Micrarchaeota archaeon]|nr:dTMP kinase [Candidatus Micrarchaeota archaeon]
MSSQKVKAGKFVVVEGLEGSGKSTQIKLLQNSLRKKGEGCIFIKEPDYENRIGAFIKKELTNKEDPLDIIALQFTFVAARFEQFAKVTAPALKEGKSVISDRNWFSTATHVAAFAPKPYSDLTWIANVHSKLPLPDAVFYIGVPPEVASERINSRGDQKRRFDSLSSLIALENAYTELSKLYPQIWHRLNGNQSTEKVHAELLAAWEDLKLK